MFSFARLLIPRYPQASDKPKLIKEPWKNDSVVSTSVQRSRLESTARTILLCTFQLFFVKPVRKLPDVYDAARFTRLAAAGLFPPAAVCCVSALCSIRHFARRATHGALCQLAQPVEHNAMLQTVVDPRSLSTKDRQFETARLLQAVLGLPCTQHVRSTMEICALQQANPICHRDQQQFVLLQQPLLIRSCSNYTPARAVHRLSASFAACVCVRPVDPPFCCVCKHIECCGSWQRPASPFYSIKVCTASRQAS